MSRVGQNRIYTPYLTVYLVISLPKIPYVHRIYMVLANPINEQCDECVCMLMGTMCSVLCAHRSQTRCKHAHVVTYVRAHTHIHTHTECIVYAMKYIVDSKRSSQLLPEPTFHTSLLEQYLLSRFAQFVSVCVCECFCMCVCVCVCACMCACAPVVARTHSVKPFPYLTRKMWYYLYAHVDAAGKTF